MLNHVNHEAKARGMYDEWTLKEGGYCIITFDCDASCSGVELMVRLSGTLQSLMEAISWMRLVWRMA